MFTLNCKGRILVVDKPLVMGIINITPDSFYEGSRFMNVQDILRQAEKMLHSGAAMLDVGGQSTRPGATQVGANEELERGILTTENTEGTERSPARASAITEHAYYRPRKCRR